MSKFQPVIKWSGTKRLQSESIIANFPKKINTYYEPFVGSGGVVRQLLDSDIEVESYVCSDINKDLIDLWNLILSDPEKLANDYKRLWTELNSIEDVEERKQYYYDVRSRFNVEKDPSDFMFIMRTTVNGMPRYNLKGEFNNAFHFSRPGINPKTLRKLIFEWSELLNKNNVKFIHSDYSNITGDTGDLIYCDPPYASAKTMYYGTLEYDRLWEWFRGHNCSYLLSFDGKTTSKDYTFEVPKDIYDEHLYLDNGNSSFRRLNGNTDQYVKESLYLKVN